MPTWHVIPLNSSPTRPSAFSHLPLLPRRTLGKRSPSGTQMADFSRKGGMGEISQGWFWRPGSAVGSSPSVPTSVEATALTAAGVPYGGRSGEVPPVFTDLFCRGVTKPPPFSRSQAWFSKSVHSPVGPWRLLYLAWGPHAGSFCTTPWGDEGKGWAAVNTSRVLTQVCPGRPEVNVQLCRFCPPQRHHSPCRH